MKFRNTDHHEEVQVQMTSMIDIVFQLLVFFIMTFKIVLPEGDFNIRMPLPSADTPSTPSETPPMTLRMRANTGGELVEMQLGTQLFEGNERFAQLHTYIRGLVDDLGGPGTAGDQEVEIDADYDLKYDYVMRSITALTGYLDNGQRYQLIEKVRLTPVDSQAGPGL